MRQINITNINWIKIIPYIVIAILLIIIINSCGGNKELVASTDFWKREAKEHQTMASKFKDYSELLKSDLADLEKKKEIVKKEIVYIKEKTAGFIPPQTTNGIATFYQRRYKIPVTITQYGTALGDSLAKLNIIELNQKDGCFQEIIKVESSLKIEEQKGVVKDTIILNLDKAFVEQEKSFKSQDNTIKAVEKALHKEKMRKSIWKVATFLTAGIGSYLLVK